MDNQTVGIIGAGHVGSHVAMSLVTQGICRRVVLIDTDEKKAWAQARRPDGQPLSSAQAGGDQGREL